VSHSDLKRASHRIVLSLVIPVFNEESAIPFFLQQLNSVFQPIDTVELDIVFVNDGSTDATLACLLQARAEDPRITIIDLTRNFKKEAALTAGLEIARGDVIVPIDADLQHPIELIPLMIEKWREGFDVVLGQSMPSAADSFLKRKIIPWFYHWHQWLSDLKLPKNVGDFRLMDRQVVDALKQLPESCRFMKGLFSWVGFRTTYIDYVQVKRVAGVSKFNGWSLWNLAIEGITSFSTVPLRLWGYLGGVLSLFSVVFTVGLIVKREIFGISAPLGFTPLILIMTFLSGLQLMGIGALGEYVGRAYMESKRRPIYLVRHIYRSDLK
jgi:glycosyltransferase involved in cell wall biosynthesis